MNDYKYVIALFLSKQNNIDINKCLDFSKNIANMYNVTYDEISFSIKDGKKTNTKTLKHVQKNIDKLLAQEVQNIAGVAFRQHKKEKNFSDQRFYLKFYISDESDYPDQIFLVIDPIQLPEEFSIDNLKEVIDKVNNLNLKVEYGTAFVIETIKDPIFFTIGVTTRYLTEEEVNVVDALSLNIRQYKSKIWDIFWINIIKKEILTQNILEGIAEVIPAKNIIEFDGKYIISLPLERAEYLNDKEKLYKYKEKLRSIFSKEGLIMYRG